MRVDRAPLPRALAWPPAGVTRALAAHPLPAALVQPERLGGEQAPYESGAMRELTEIDLGHESVPDESKICK